MPFTYLDEQAPAPEQASTGKFTYLDAEPRKEMGGALAQAGKGIYDTMHQIPGIRQLMDVNPELGEMAKEVPEPAGAGQRLARMAGEAAGVTPAFMGGEALMGGRLIGGALGIGAQQALGDLQEGKTKVDTAVDAAKTTAGVYVGGKVLNAAGEALGSALSTPAQKISSVVTDLYNKAVKPTTAKGNNVLAEKAARDIESGVRSIVEHKENLNLGDEGAKIPETLNHTSEAIEQTKNTIFNKYNKMQQDATGNGVTINGQGLAQALQPIIDDKALQVVSPQTKEYAVNLFERLQQAGEMTPDELQAMIKGYNGRLKAFYRNPSPDQYGNTAVDALIANNARKSLDDAITGAVGEGYQALKNQYGALSAMEKDVARAAQRASNYQAKGLLDFSDILTGEQVARGLLSGNPSEIATGISGRLIKEYYKRLNSPDANIKKMFSQVEKYMQEESQPSLSEAAAGAVQGAKTKLGGLLDAVPSRLGVAGRAGSPPAKPILGEEARMAAEGGPAGTAEEPLPFGGAGEVKQTPGQYEMRGKESTSPVPENFDASKNARENWKNYEKERPYLAESWKNKGKGGGRLSNEKGFARLSDGHEVKIGDVIRFQEPGGKNYQGEVRSINGSVLKIFNRDLNRNFTANANLSTLVKAVKDVGKSPLGLSAGAGLATGAALWGKNAKAAENIDMNRIYMIESSNNPQAYNTRTGARGLAQLKEDALKDWNSHHKDEQHRVKDLFDAEVNKKIADWYMNQRIPQMLKHYKLPDTKENRLIAYNFGIGNLKNKKPLPKETKDYIRKYNGGAK